MKRFISAALVALLLLPLVFVFSSCESEGGVTTLYVYNWGEYISDGSDDSLDSNEAFEEWYYEEYGERVKVNYSTYSSNEDLYAKISSGTVNYDVIVPSDYMIERMIKEDMLSPLNYENIPNIENLSEEFFDTDNEAPFSYYDPKNVYSVPYFYGVVFNSDNFNVVSVFYVVVCFDQPLKVCHRVFIRFIINNHQSFLLHIAAPFATVR